MSNELDFCTCMIAIGGDVRQIVYRGESNPVSVPEIDILLALHGESSVNNIEYCRTEPSTPGDEKNRLLAKYSPSVVNAIFPGRTPNMPMISGVRPGKDIPTGDRKQRPSTKTTAAKPFLPPSDDNDD